MACRHLLSLGIIATCLAVQWRPTATVRTTPRSHAQILEFRTQSPKTLIFYTEQNLSRDATALEIQKRLKILLPNCWEPVDRFRFEIFRTQTLTKIRLSPIPEYRMMELGIKMDINRVGKNDLIRIPGIGPTLERRIREKRMALRRFTSLDQLAEIRGIKSKRQHHLTGFVKLASDEKR